MGCLLPELIMSLPLPITVITPPIISMTVTSVGNQQLDRLLVYMRVC